MKNKYPTTHNWWLRIYNCWLSLSKPQLTTKAIAIITASSILVQTIVPTASYALTGGPQNPEFSKFESVSTDQMVDPFTGDFTYNLPILDVPGPNGGGYPISLSYHSGSSPEEEASWVGYGWTLNPGAINRNKRGLADDLYKSDITYYNKMPDNTTVSIRGTAETNIRAFGIPSELIQEVLSGWIGEGSVGISGVLSYNNYKGVTFQTIPYLSYQLGLKNTTISLDLDEDWEDAVRYSYTYTSPIMFIASLSSRAVSMGLKESRWVRDRAAAQGFDYISKTANILGSTSSSRLEAYTLHNNSFPASLSEYEGHSYSLSAGFYTAAAPLPIGMGVSLSGSAVWQSLTDTKNRDAYGYLYSDKAEDNEEAVMDFSVEKDEDFNLRDEILPIPYSSADDFTVVGEGIAGAMRLYSAAPGEFFPAYTHSHTDMGSLGVQVTGGATCSITADIAMEIEEDDDNKTEGQSITISRWEDDGENDDYDFAKGGPEKYYFRFKGDMGGSSSFVQDDEVQYAHLLDGGVHKIKAGVYADVNDGAGVERSTFVGYHTNEEMEETDGSGHAYKRYSLRDTIEDVTVRSGNDTENGDDNIEKRIGELEIVNKTRNHYTYGLPLYAKNEKEISFSVSGKSTDAHIIYANEEDADRKFGHKVNDRYAASYLLTQITTPNFIDTDHNGPDEGDFGGWTNFNYTKSYGETVENTPYYHWRNPYKGQIYHAGDYSNPNDDMGSYESGDREVAYLASIETATHIAVFELNDQTTEKRYDGLSAANDEVADSDDDAQGSHRLRYLKTIKLYVKDDDNTELSDNELIKTVHLEYDYSLMQGLPNSDGASDSSGKLTLKKVWFEYNGVHNAGISPYTFEYAYPTDISYPSPYGATDSLSVTSEYASLSADDQNPDYDADNTDVWGMYQNDGASHYSNYYPWLTQNSSDSLDPAAWHLKGIKLPTGAEIHVQYEQDDYRYVQDRNAMAMAEVTRVVESGEHSLMGVGNSGAKYYLGNLDKLGMTSDDYDELENLLYTNYVYSGKKMYFKFLYEVNTSCGSEYIDGYANIMAAGVEEDASSDYLGQFYITIGDPLSYDELASPCEACKEYYKANKGLQINAADACDNTLSVNAEESSTAESSILSLLDLSVNDVFEQGCQTMNVSGKSYLKIPMLHAKKGGGVRVKRLLTYDPGIESDNADKSLYGSEFIYQNTDDESSGVATNEPNRDENALITYFQKRSESSKDQILVSGEDKSQFEGPVGEYVLPGPSVGYERVVVKNIYSGATNDGFSVNSFYTAKDYPFDWGDDSNDDYCGVKYSEIDKKIDEPTAPEFGFFTNTVKANYKVTQGYRFVIANMHGKPKSISQYDGDYADINNPTECSLLASTEYNYFEPGEKIPTMTDYGKFSEEQLGKETELVCYSKRVEETVKESHLTLESGEMSWVPLAIPYVLPFYMRTEDLSYLYMHIMNQIIYFPPVLKSVTNFIDGTYRTVYNKYFDPKTGDVLVQQSSGNYDQLVFDGNAAHEGKYSGYNLPAHLYYNGMGQMAGSENYSFESGTADITLTKNLMSNALSFSGTADDIIAHFSEGDLIAIYKVGTNTQEIYNVTEVSSSSLSISPVSGYYQATGGGYEVGTSIIKSGKANLLTAKAGSYTVYGSKADSIIGASALTYANQWEMSDDLKAYYGADSENPVETGESGKWHLENSYFFIDDIKSMDDDVSKIYNAGILKNFDAFDWENTSGISSKWQNLTTCTDYTPNGNLIEEKNLYDIHSTNKFGYGGNLVCIDAKNATYESLLFEGFEYNGGEEMSVSGKNTLSDEKAHSGKYSMEIGITEASTSAMSTMLPSTYHWGYFTIFSNHDRTNQIKHNGFAVKMWAKTNGYSPTFTLHDASAYTMSGTDGKPKATGTENFTSVEFDSIASTGEWTLYEAKVKPSAWVDYGSGSSSVSEYGLQVYFEISGAHETPEIFIDDIRVQPTEAMANCYVYDPATYKVLTVFDDQHFGLFYQYNDEGQLVRKLKETVRGMKTLVETQYNIPTESRK